jgi:hypothetical protein
MTAPAPSVCPMCDGDGILGTVEDNYPCPECHCICGGPPGHRHCELLDDIDDDYRHKINEGSR